MIQYWINNALTDSDLIKSDFNSDEQLIFDYEKIITPQVDILLDNTDKSYFDPDYSGSLFYNADWYNWPVVIYDTVLKRTLWSGLIRGMETSDSDNQIKLITANYIDDTKTNCVCNYMSLTFSEIAYNLLTLICGIDPLYISKSSFDFLTALNSGKLFDCIVTKENNATVKDILELIQGLTQSIFFSKNNIIYAWQWAAWSGGIGQRLVGKEIDANSLKTKYDLSRIINDYNIVYKNGSVVAYATADDDTSVARYGIKSLAHPKSKSEETSPAKFTLLPVDKATADYYGALAITRFKDMLRVGDLKIFDTMDYVQIGQQIDFDFRSYKREPVFLKSKIYDKAEKKITINFEYLNQPTEFYDRDIEAPAPPLLVTAMPIGANTVGLKFTQNQESDFLGNKIYFASGDDFEQESCQAGQSPIDVKMGTNVTTDGYYYVILTQLTNYLPYKFKVTAYDTRFNESDFSNVIECIPYPSGTMYRVSGDISIEGLRLDPTNSMRGILPANWLRFGDGTKYGSKKFQPSGIYESPVFEHSTAWTVINWQSAGAGISFAVKESDDNVTWDAWRYMSAIWVKTAALSKKYVRYQFIFNRQPAPLTINDSFVRITEMY